MDPRAALTGALRLDWAVAARPFPGQALNGDAAWTRVEEARAQVAVIDGLGHGPEAAAASEAARAALEHWGAESLERKLSALQEALSRTRGAALALVDVDLAARRLRWLGVGNIFGLLAGPERRERLVNANGIVGAGTPQRLRIRELPLEEGSLLVLATDGLHEGFLGALDPLTRPAALTGLLLDRHARANDDALLWMGSFHA